NQPPAGRAFLRRWSSPRLYAPSTRNSPAPQCQGYIFPDWQPRAAVSGTGCSHQVCGTRSRESLFSKRLDFGPFGFRICPPPGRYREVFEFGGRAQTISPAGWIGSARTAEASGGARVYLRSWNRVSPRPDASARLVHELADPKESSARNDRDSARRNFRRESQ